MYEIPNNETTAFRMLFNDTNFGNTLLLHNWGLMALEYLMYNPNYNLYVYNSIVFGKTSSGKVKTLQFSETSKLKFYQTPSE